MCHSFRGGQQSIAKIKQWTKGEVVLTEVLAKDDLRKLPSGKEVLNRVRFDTRLAELVSARAFERPWALMTTWSKPSRGAPP